MKITKNQALENLGYNKFDLLKDGYTGDDTTSLLGENGIYKCDCCKSWKEAATTDGNDEGTLCEECFENSEKEIAVKARRIYAELNA